MYVRISNKPFTMAACMGHLRLHPQANHGNWQEQRGLQQRCSLNPPKQWAMNNGG